MKRLLIGLVILNCLGSSGAIANNYESNWDEQERMFQIVGEYALDIAKEETDYGIAETFDYGLRSKAANAYKGQLPGKPAIHYFDFKTESFSSANTYRLKVLYSTKTKKILASSDRAWASFYEPSNEPSSRDGLYGAYYCSFSDDGRSNCVYVGSDSN